MLCGKAIPCIGGVGSKQVVKRLVDSVVSEFGKPDILVNNAVIMRDALMSKMEERQLAR